MRIGGSLVLKFISFRDFEYPDYLECPWVLSRRWRLCVVLAVGVGIPIFWLSSFLG